VLRGSTGAQLHPRCQIANAYHDKLIAVRDRTGGVMFKRRSFAGLVAFVGLLLSACYGQPPAAHEPAPLTDPAPGFPAPEVTVLRHARLIDGLGHPVVENAMLVISNGYVLSAGLPDQFEIPTGATVIDLGGKTVLPGLISDHSHLGLVNGTTAGSENYTRENILRQLAQFEAYGVTTVMSLGLNGPLFYEVQSDMRAGRIGGADLLGADRGLGVPQAAPPVKVDDTQIYRPATAEQARQMVRESAARGPALLKIWVDDFHGTLPQKMAPEIYRAIIEEAHRAHLRVAAHVYYLEDAKQLVAAGVDVLAHGVRDRPVDDDFIQAMKAHGTWYVPTLQLDESFFVYADHPPWMDTPFFKHSLQPALAAQFDDPTWRAKTLANTAQISTERAAFSVSSKNLKALHDAGVRIGFGTDSGATPLRIPGFAEHRELELMTQAGLSPLEAITIATSGAAALLELEDRGALTNGKLADLLIVDGRPDATISALDHIVAVWHRGRLVSKGPTDFTP
jgi:imidazolonepropionase-like amidohydrolase